ncbi:branched-chain amino acid aminotransferase [Taibaiella sp. KBW10]|uniref:AMP-binding protein n=1 Tax=Taibaiella sp. KBW10 TaxID=2153357 RepID=UPI000F59082F|nr:AMP-binding protein [Taibaiella sp. KBW10]RQO31393.1 branched-chain amino acid aminotransferase [Taibaiella sp. KBW10]
MEHIFRTFRDLIAQENYDALANMPLTKPERFNWVKEVFEDINIKDSPDATALLWTDGVHTHTYSFRQMGIACNQLLNLLRAHGLTKGDVILTQLSLQVINWQAILCTIKGGFRMIPAATILGTNDISYRFQRLLPKAVIADQDNAAKIEAAEQQSGVHINVKIIAEGQRAGWISISEILQYDSTAAAAETRSDDPLFLFFTSGTTGMPKVVTHTQFSYPVGHLTTASWIGIKAGDIHYNISQPGWAKFTWSSFFAPWSVGATIFAYHTTGRFHAQTQLSLIAQHRISTFCAPPTVLRMLIVEDLGAYSFSFRSCVAAGEPLNPEIIEAWKKGTGILIRDGFGQTESTCMVANMPNSKVKFGSMGKATFLYEVIIADDAGNEIPVSEEGNICVHTDRDKPNGIFLEYLDEPEKMNAVFKHGLYYTGDKAYKDEEGYLWFVGRDDDVIKSSDYRVGPFEVESVLLEHEAVLESAVVGSPHPVKGYEIKAFVVLGAAYEPSAELAGDLFSFAKGQLAPYKMPRVIEFVQDLPKTISGKIRRVELRALEAERKAKNTVPDNEYRP